MNKTTTVGCWGRMIRLLATGAVAIIIFLAGVSVGRNSQPSIAPRTTMAITATSPGALASIAASPEPTGTPLPTDVPEPSPTPEKTLDEIKAESVIIEYKDLYRNIETHTGKVLHATGKIVQVAKQKTTVIFGDDYETTIMRVDITKDEFGNYSDTVWLEYNGEERFLEDDVIEFWATVEGLQEYKSIFGGAVELPRLTVEGLELVQE